MDDLKKKITNSPTIRLPTDERTRSIDPLNTLLEEADATSSNTPPTDEQFRNFRQLMELKELTDRVVAASCIEPTIDQQNGDICPFNFMIQQDDTDSTETMVHDYARSFCAFSDADMATGLHPMYENITDFLRAVKTSEWTNSQASSMFENNLRSNIMFSLYQNAQQTPNNGSNLSAEQYTIVFVWDLDDITALSKKRMEKISQEQPNIDSMSLKRLVESVLNSVNLSNPDDIASRCVMDIEDAINSDCNYSANYHELKNLYRAVSDRKADEESIVSHELLKSCGMIGEEDNLCRTASKIQEIQHQRWKWVEKSMKLVNRKSAESRDKKYANVVLSKESVAQAVAQILVSRHCSEIEIENVFSTFGVSKTLVWEKIQRRFGASCNLILLTSRLRSCPRDIHVGVGVVKNEGSIEYIYNALRDTLK